MFNPFFLDFFFYDSSSASFAAEVCDSRILKRKLTLSQVLFWH